MLIKNHKSVWIFHFDRLEQKEGQIHQGLVEWKTVVCGRVQLAKSAEKAICLFGIFIAQELENGQHTEVDALAPILVQHTQLKIGSLFGSGKFWPFSRKRP